MFKDTADMRDWMDVLNICTNIDQHFVNFLFNTRDSHDVFWGCDGVKMKKKILGRTMLLATKSCTMSEQNVIHHAIDVAAAENSDLEDAFIDAQNASRNTQNKRARLNFMFNIHPRLVPLHEFGVQTNSGTSNVSIYKQRMNDVLRELKTLSETTKQSLKNIDKEKCPICLDVIEKPTITQCGHVFCKECIESAMRANTRKQCPLCRTKCNTMTEISEVADESILINGKAVSRIVSDAYFDMSNKSSNLIDDIIKRCAETKTIIYSKYAKVLDMIYTKLLKMHMKATKVKHYTNKTSFEGTILMYKNVVQTPVEFADVKCIIALDPSMDILTRNQIVARTLDYGMRNEGLHIITYNV